MGDHEGQGPVSGIRSLHPLVTAIPELEICPHNDMLQLSTTTHQSRVHVDVSSVITGEKKR